MLVAAFPGISSKQLCDWLDMQPAALSRNIKSLSQYKDSKSGEIKGHQLLEARPSLEFGRQFAYTLTAKGAKLMQKMGLTVKEGGDERLQKR